MQSMQSGAGLGITVSRPPGANPPPKPAPIAKRAQTQVHGSKSNDIVPYNVPFSIRSSREMTGVSESEIGASPAGIDKHVGDMGARFKAGLPIEPESMSPVFVREYDPNVSTATASRHDRARVVTQDQGLSRRETLLSSHASPTRRAAELTCLLGGSSAKVSSGAMLSASTGRSQNPPNAVAFEQGKARARVSLDLVLENNTAVEGGYISGCVQLHIAPPPKRKDRHNDIVLGEGKIRIAGFEVLSGNGHRHIFYQVAAPLKDISEGLFNLYSSPPDKDGFGTMDEGTYVVPFSLKLPVAGVSGRPKGVISTRSGIEMRYIVIA